MTNYRFSDHARDRSVQRGIPLELVEFVLDHGDVAYSNGGRIYFCPRSKISQRLTDSLSIPLVEKLAKLPYIVVQDECVITVGYRYKRIKHNYISHKLRYRRVWQ